MPSGWVPPSGLSPGLVHYTNPLPGKRELVHTVDERQTDVVWPETHPCQIRCNARRADAKFSSVSPDDGFSNLVTRDSPAS